VTDVGWLGMARGGDNVGTICGTLVEERRDGAKESVVMEEVL
jgi:hypothetical protein